MVSQDVMRRVIGGMSLWDARSLQRAIPSCAALVREAVATEVARALQAECPRMIHTFWRAPPGFRELVHGDYVCMRTPGIPDVSWHRPDDDIMVQWCRRGIAVVMHIHRAHVRIEIRMVDPSVWPRFSDLGGVLCTLHAFALLLKSTGVQTAAFETRSHVHRPVFEVLNSVASVFVRQHLVPMFERAYEVK